MKSNSSKHRLLTQKHPARVEDIGEAIVIKDEGLAFLCRPDGAVPRTKGHGLGLYYHDCRFLDRYELRLAGAPLEGLAANCSDGFRSVFQLANPDIEWKGARFERHHIAVRWRHVIDARSLALHDEIVIQNYHPRECELPLTLTFEADFADVFTIRSLTDDRPGTRRANRWDGEGLVFEYEGGDRRTRRLLVRFSEPPARHSNHDVTFDLRLAPQHGKRIVVSFEVVESSDETRSKPVTTGKQAISEAEGAFSRSISEWLEGFTRVSSDSQWLDRVVDRSLRDLRALRSALDGHRFFAAGVPWFMTLFGRDSLTCALQTLAFRPEIAADTLRLLASFQGQRVDEWSDEQPGKILHELRVGELARMGRIPHTPYYGTVDATPLFLIVLAEHAAWTGSLALFQELRGNVDAALRWMADYGDSDHDGYLDYRSASSAGGWSIRAGRTPGTRS